MLLEQRAVLMWVDGWVRVSVGVGVEVGAVLSCELRRW